MSLVLDHGPHVVYVLPQVQHTTARGDVVWRPADTSVRVTGVTMSPLAAERGPDGRIDATYRFTARSAPLGPWSRVLWNGRTLSVAKGPTVFDASPATTHVSATLRLEA